MHSVRQQRNVCFWMTVCLGLIATTSFCGAAPPTNLAPNPDFEKSLRPWQQWPRDGSSTVLVELDDEVRLTGESSVRITATDIDSRVSLYTYVTLSEGRTYELSFWYRARNWHSSPGRGVQLSLNFNKKDGGNGSAGVVRHNLPVDELTPSGMLYQFS